MVKDEYGASKSVEKTIDAVQHDVSTFSCWIDIEYRNYVLYVCFTICL